MRDWERLGMGIPERYAEVVRKAGEVDRLLFGLKREPEDKFDYYYNLVRVGHEVEVLVRDLYGLLKNDIETMDYEPEAKKVLKVWLSSDMDRFTSELSTYRKRQDLDSGIVVAQYLGLVEGKLEDLYRGLQLAKKRWMGEMGVDVERAIVEERIVREAVRGYLKEVDEVAREAVDVMAKVDGRGCKEIKEWFGGAVGMILDGVPEDRHDFVYGIFDKGGFEWIKRVLRGGCNGGVGRRGFLEEEVGELYNYMMWTIKERLIGIMRLWGGRLRDVYSGVDWKNVPFKRGIAPEALWKKHVVEYMVMRPSGFVRREEEEEGALA